MEKTYTLDQRETALLQQVDQERMNALSVIGALSLDMEVARKNLDNAAERQRSFIRQALSTRGVERYENARAANGALVVTMPDGMAVPTAPDAPRIVERVNGPIDVVRE
jgi:hypothetical protein